MSECQQWNDFCPPPHNTTPDHLRDKTSKIGVSGWVGRVGADAEVSDFPSMFTLHHITARALVMTDADALPCAVTHYHPIIPIHYLTLRLQLSSLKNQGNEG